MSRHRKQRHPYGQPTSTPHAPASPPAPPAQEDTRAATYIEELTALRAQIEQTRRDLNARLDALTATIDRLLGDQAYAPAPAPSSSSAIAAPVPSPTPPASATPSASRPVLSALRAGDEVYVPRLGGTFRILEVAPHGRAFTVQSGAMRVQVRRDEVWSLDGAAAPAAAKAEALSRHIRPELSATIEEIDLHGFTEDEALITLELFLQQVYARRVTRVRIIHGKGNGILRAAVRRELARNPLVRSVETGPHFHGDEGVTLADLDL